MAAFRNHILSKHYNVQEPCCLQESILIWVSWASTWSWWHRGLSCSQGPCLSPWPNCIWSLCYHQKLCGYPDLGYHLRPHRYSRATLLLEPCWSDWPALPIRTMVTSQPEVWPRAMSESIVVMSLVYVTFGAMGELARVAWSTESWSCSLVTASVGKLSPF